MCEERASRTKLIEVTRASVVQTTEGTGSRIAVSLREATVAVSETPRCKQIKLRPETSRTPIVERGSGQSDNKSHATASTDFHDGDGSIDPVYLGVSLTTG